MTPRPLARLQPPMAINGGSGDQMAMAETRTSRTAWGLVAILAMVLLGSVALLLFQLVSTSLREKSLVDAAKRGDVGVVEALLDHGTSVNARDHSKSAFEYAIELGDTRIVSAFLAHGASVAARGPWGVPPLTVAIICHQPAIVNVLLAHGADPNASDGEPPPLIFAASDGPEIVRALIAHGADVNAKNMTGVTPLMQAVVFRRPAVVKLLVAHGADMNAKEYETGQPNSALTLALDSFSNARKERQFGYASDYAAIIQLLKAAGAKE